MINEMVSNLVRINLSSLRRVFRYSSVSRIHGFCSSHVKNVIAGIWRGLSTGGVASPVLSFEEAAAVRREQAARSVLVQVRSANSAQSLAAHLSQFDAIQKMFQVVIRNKEYFLVELTSADAVECLLRHGAAHSRCDDTVPVTSPLLWLRAGTPRHSAPESVPFVPHQPEQASEVHQWLLQCRTLDEQLAVYQRLCSLTELGTRLRYFTCHLLERAVSGMFPGAAVRPFGSSVNGFGRYDCDVDMVLQLHVHTAQQISEPLRFQCLSTYSDRRVHTQRFLSLISQLLEMLLPGCAHVRRILKARVPIIKYTNTFTNIDCDLTMERNGLKMTGLLYTWCQLDSRVSPLVLAVRRWASLVGVTQAVSGFSGNGSCISNFGLTLLVIYFLQSRDVPVLPSGSQLLLPPDPDSDEVWGAVRHPNSVAATSCLSSPQLSTGQLLVELLHFYADWERVRERSVSVLGRHDTERHCDDPLYVENPLSPGVNVCRNVTADQLTRFCAEAGRAAGLLQTGSEEHAQWRQLLVSGARGQLQHKTHKQMMAVSISDLLSTPDDVAEEAARGPEQAARGAEGAAPGRGGGEEAARGAEEAARRRGGGEETARSTQPAGLQLSELVSPAKPQLPSRRVFDVSMLIGGLTDTAARHTDRPKTEIQKPRPFDQPRKKRKRKNRGSS